MIDSSYTLPLAKLGMQDIDKVGGKNASLGEMIQHLTAAGVKVPDGFATTSAAYWSYLEQNEAGLEVFALLKDLDINNVSKLAEVGKAVRERLNQEDLPPLLVDQITERYKAMGDSVSVAVRSSATAEDLPTASFAGQQETYLNIVGLDAVLAAVKKVYISLFTDRAISYRQHQGFCHDKVALSVCIQRMVRSDLATSGVMFSVDTESGFDKVVFITGAYGLGETVVQGMVNPDEFYVYKPALAAGKPAILRRHLGSKLNRMIFADSENNDKSDHGTVDIVPVEEDKAQKFCIDEKEVEALARDAVLIEQHYGRPMDIEWAKDGVTGEIFIVQARPETVVNQNSKWELERYHLPKVSELLVTGRAVGQKIGQGSVRILRNFKDMDAFKEGEILVTDMTDPDWEPVMKKASAIVTNRGGRTCHAAIIARELGIPAVVGCGDATSCLENGVEVTVSCAEGDEGKIYKGLLDIGVQKVELNKMPKLPFKIMMNVANPLKAFTFQKLPNDGIGLARLEFIINTMIGIHPQALLNYHQVPLELQQRIKPLVKAYSDPVSFYVDRLAEGIATLAASFYPKPVIVRLSDFKSNEYAHLIGGEYYEPDEENPMLGFRGASRYLSPSFEECFALEAKALYKVRETMGLDNIQIMVPFVRTVDEGQGVLALLEKYNLKQGQNGLKIIMMCELPTNCLLADEYLEHFDGFSVGSNDLTQLTLGLDRDSSLVAKHFDERDPAVKILLAKAISAAKVQQKYIGICGQGPSDHPDFALWLMEHGIDSVSLNPDSVIDTWLYLAKELAVEEAS